MTRHSRCSATAVALLSGALTVSRSGAAAPVQDQPLAPTAAEREMERLAQMDLGELLNIHVVSASNADEHLSDAPATVIVLTRNDLLARGYSELSQILDDLPGMHLSRSFGDTGLKNYWRGYRNDIGDPYLMLIDGMIFNHLYFNTTDAPMEAMPLSNIDRVEVVYGPASSVYGANAFMGVINVITSKDRAEDGVSSRVLLLASGGAPGAHSARIADLTAFYKKGPLRISLSGRFDDSSLDQNTSENYEYTKNRYYTNRQLWGATLDNPSLAGPFESPSRNRALDVRVYFGETELGLLYLLKDTGYGTTYPADKVQANATWALPEYTLYLREAKEFTSWLTSTTLLRYRESGVRGDSYFVDAYDNGSAAKGTNYSVEFSWWPSQNHSVALNQDFNVVVNENLSLVTGFKYEQKSLQKAYGIYGQLEPVATVNLAPGSPFYPVQPGGPGLEAQNRITTSDTGAYVQGKIRINENHSFNLGARYDDNSVYGGDATFRAGYVFRLGAFGAKALFGQAYQEPAPRLLFGGWSGSGSDKSLSPEKSTTYEVSGTYTQSQVSALLSLWATNNTDTIASAKNLGKRNVRGGDLHVQVLVPQKAIPQWKAWAYYSRIFSADEDVLDAQKNKIGSVRIGDLSNWTLLFGSTATINEFVNATLLGHWVGARPTIVSNPVRQVDAHFTLDLNVNATWRGMTLMLKANNLFDSQYFEPGLRDAAAGVTPGAFNGPGGTWTGSNSYYNSLLPQPGRYFTLALKTEF